MSDNAVVEEDKIETPPRRKRRGRPPKVSGATYKLKTGCGSLYITVNYDKYGLLEVFARMGKAGGCFSAQSDAITRIISLALQNDVEPEKIIEKLRHIKCPSPSTDSGETIQSCADAIARAMEMALERGGE